MPEKEPVTSLAKKPAARKKRAHQKLAPSFPEVVPRKLVKIHKSHYILMPPTWFRAHRLDPGKIDELLTASDTDFLVLNPRSVKQFTRRISALIRPSSLASARGPPRKRRAKKLAKPSR